jgi:PAS domain-containing protein
MNIILTPTDILIENVIISMFVSTIFFVMLMYLSRYFRKKKNTTSNKLQNDDIVNEIKVLEKQVKNDQNVIDNIMLNKNIIDNSFNSNFILNNILYNIVIPIFIIDEDKNLLFMNDAFIQFLKIDKKAISFQKRIDIIKNKKTNNNLNLILSKLSISDEKIVESDEEEQYFNNKVVILNIDNEIKHVALLESYYKQPEKNIIVTILIDLVKLEELVNNGKIELGQMKVIEKN